MKILFLDPKHELHDPGERSVRLSWTKYAKFGWISCVVKFLLISIQGSRWEWSRWRTDGNCFASSKGPFDSLLRLLYRLQKLWEYIHYTHAILKRETTWSSWMSVIFMLMVSKPKKTKNSHLCKLQGKILRCLWANFSVEIW